MTDDGSVTRQLAEALAGCVQRLRADDECEGPLCEDCDGCRSGWECTAPPCGECRPCRNDQAAKAAEAALSAYEQGRTRLAEVLARPECQEILKIVEEATQSMLRKAGVQQLPNGVKSDG